MKNLEFAINMELEGIRFYTKQAVINKDNGLYAVCTMLADDEARHAKMLIDSMRNDSFKLSEQKVDPSQKNVFSDISEKELKDIGQLDFYRIALGKEKESIELYAEFSENATEPSEKNFFDYMVNQEQHHYNILEELTVLLRHSEEWVEAAEFGVRKKY